MDERVGSPTFTIGRRYRAEGCPIAHLDLYRLADLEGEEPALLEDYLDAETVSFVEWPAVAEPRLASRAECSRSGWPIWAAIGARIESRRRIHPQIAVFREGAGRVASATTNRIEEEEGA